MASAAPTRGWKALAALVAVLLGLCILANTGLGLFELIPDGAPLFGNLDEALATVALVWGLAVLFRTAHRSAG